MIKIKHKLAIITINYNGLADTLDFLESLKSATKPASLILQVYIVDNASSDDSVDVLSRRYPEIRLIESSKNLGFAAGNNLGIKRALKEKNDLIMLINNDTSISKDLFIKLLDSPILKTGTGVLGGLIYFASGFEFHKKYKKNQIGKVIWFGGGQIDWDNIYATHQYVNQIDTGQIKSPQETDFITGAFFITRSDVLRKVDLFNPDYFMYLEDVELCLRIKRAGFKLFIDPNLKVWHKVAQSSGIGSPLNDYFLTRNRLVFGFGYAKFRTKQALLREALRKFFGGSFAQKLAVKDFFIHKLGPGSLTKLKSK